MPIDTQTPQGGWLESLAQDLFTRQWRLDRLDAYFKGDPPLPEALSGMKDVARDFFHTSRTNFAELVAEAPRERMQPVGVRTAADSGESGDRAAWNVWTKAGLPVVSADVHQSMLTLGDGYAIVAWDERRSRPVVTAEDPRQVITSEDPLTGEVLAALKLYRDFNDGTDYAYVYLPGAVFVAEKPAQTGVPVTLGGNSFSPVQWNWNLDRSAPLPAGFEDVIPVVRFRNRDGVGEFERHTDVLDRINRTILRRMVITTFQAFRQRAVKGDLPEYDEAGVLIDYDKLLEAGPDAMWMLPPDVDIWESGQVDLTPILGAVKSDVLFLAAVTRTPLSMLTPDAAAQSAEGASLQREGLVFRTEDRIARATAGWARVVSLMFRFAGDTVRADDEQVQVVWAPVERYGLAETASAWSLLAGLPFETKLRVVFRMSPDEIAQAKTEAADEQLMAALFQTPAQKPPMNLPPGTVAGP